MFAGLLLLCPAPASPGPIDPGFEHNRQFPAGGFFAGAIPGTGGAWQPFDENAQLALHRVRPAVPEPGLPALPGMGLAALMWMRRRSQAAGGPGQVGPARGSSQRGERTVRGRAKASRRSDT